MNDLTHTHCIPISSQVYLIAAPDGRCWTMEIGGSRLASLPVSRLAAERASLASSAIEGAIAAGLSQSGHTPAPFALLRYIRWLAGNYVFAGQTPGLFRQAAQRFEAAGQPKLMEFAMRKAEEETGHAELAYRDLEALGLPAADVIRVIAPPSAQIFADHFRAHVESEAPIALFGFSYCLERMAVERDDAFVRKVEAIYPGQYRASRFLKVHSNIGSDGAHVDEQLAFFESLSSSELTTVARAAYETAELLGRQPLMDRALSDTEIERRLRLARIEIPGHLTLA
jgi:hypothetical protein